MQVLKQLEGKLLIIHNMSATLLTPGACLCRPQTNRKHIKNNTVYMFKCISEFVHSYRRTPCIDAHFFP